MRPLGLAAAAAAVAGSRVLLDVAHAPERLLPRSLASPSLFGTAAAWDLMRSPAAFALTALASLALAGALRRFAREAPGGGRLPFALLATAACAAGGAGLAAGAQLRARDARVPVLDIGAAVRDPGHLALLLGLAVTIFAVAAGAGAAVHAWERLAGSTTRLTRIAPSLALLAGSMLAVGVMNATAERIAIERLRSEFAPQVLEQSAQRRVALLAAVREAAQSARVRETLLGPPGGDGAATAYAAWLAGPLFHQGFMSSIDLFDAAGTARGHFAFALPPFDEPAPSRIRPDGDVGIADEDLPLAAARQHYLHAETTVWAGGRPVGTVVGHVLDEPDNLPFLPSVAPYLAALGPGAARAAGTGGPDYVLYDEQQDVVLHTVQEPPAAGAEIRDAARRGTTVPVAAGSERYVGLPLEDRGRLHLLLAPARSALDWLVGVVRLVLVLAALGVAAAGAARFARPGGVRGWTAAWRGSLYRKLLATILLASVVPLVGFALFLRGYVERRIEARFVESNTAIVGAVRRVVEDYAAVRADDPSRAAPHINDVVLSWLRGIVGQEIHLYRSGAIDATSKPELFSSGLLLPRLPGEVQRAVLEGGLPFLVRTERLGPTPIPVAYARVDLPGPDGRAVVAVPLIVQQRDIARAVQRILEMLMLATVTLAALLTLASAWLARNVARPVRGLVAATERIARGDYTQRLETATRDEIATLVAGFNSMAASLAAQRADLERRRDYTEALLRNATTGVVSTDPEGRVVTINPAAAQLIAAVGGVLEPGGLLAEAVARIPRLAPLAAALRRPVRAAAEPEEVDLLLPRGARRLRLVRATLPDPFGGAPGTLYLVDDVTELMRSNQLAAWAEMARAIAHEIKNPLTPIQLSTEHLERLLRDRAALPAPEVEACLDTILKQVRALREIASEFSAYAKLPALRPEPTDLATFLGETVRPYRASPPEGIVIVESHEPAPPVAVDRRVMARAVVNLVENALQAMPAGGTLSITSGPDAGGACFEVTDTGEGLAPEVRARLFEPYFSTKSSGTGLGLAIVKRAVEEHGGRIEIVGGEGARTTFRVVFPASA